MVNANFETLKEDVIFPTLFQIQTINACNGRCTMCPYTYQKKDKVRHMDNTLFEKIIKDIAEGAKLTTRVKVTLMLQNEPFLDANLIDKIKFAKRFDRLYVDTVTNGTILNEDILKGLETSGIDSLTISIDSVDKKNFEAIRAGIDFEKVMKNVELLLSSSLKDKLIIQMIVQRRNQQEIGGFIDFWKSKGLRVRALYATNRGGMLKNFDSEIKADYAVLASKLKMFRRHYLQKNLKRHYLKTTSFCKHPFYSLNILCNGDAIKCCHDWTHTDIAGNVGKNTVKEIWDSKFKSYRHLFLAGKYCEVEPCKDCSIYEYLQQS